MKAFGHPLVEERGFKYACFVKGNQRTPQVEFAISHFLKHGKFSDKQHQYLRHKRLKLWKLIVDSFTPDGDDEFSSYAAACLALIMMDRIILHAQKELNHIDIELLVLVCLRLAYKLEVGRNYIYHIDDWVDCLKEKGLPHLESKTMTKIERMVFAFFKGDISFQTVFGWMDHFGLQCPEFAIWLRKGWGISEPRVQTDKINPVSLCIKTLWNVEYYHFGSRYIALGCFFISEIYNENTQNNLLTSRLELHSDIHRPLFLACCDHIIDGYKSQLSNIPNAVVDKLNNVKSLIKTLSHQFCTSGSLVDQQGSHVQLDQVPLSIMYYLNAFQFDLQMSLQEDDSAMCCETKDSGRPKSICDNLPELLEIYTTANSDASPNSLSPHNDADPIIDDSPQLQLEANGLETQSSQKTHLIFLLENDNYNDNDNDDVRRLKNAVSDLDKPASMADDNPHRLSRLGFSNFFIYDPDDAVDPDNFDSSMPHLS